MNQPPTPSPLSDRVRRTRRLLRIAMVTESYPPEVNGVANSVARVVEGLRARLHSVQVVRPRQHDGDQPDEARGQFDLLTRGMRIPKYAHLHMGLPCAGLLERHWSGHRPDLVHIATEGPLGWSALRAARKLKLPVCSAFRTNFHAYSQFHGIGWLQRPIVSYLRRFHNDCHGTMVPTDAQRRHLAQQGFQSLTVVARGVNTELFSPQRRSAALRAQWGAADDDMVALYVGRLAPEKNLWVMLDAFEFLRSRHPRTRLVVVGDGPSRADIAARCPQAIFAGFRTGEELAAHYASSDVFLFPSLTETFGNVTPEAMASGLAVLAFDDAAAGQLIEHRSSGLLARKGDVGAFVGLAHELARDPPMRRQLGQQARQRALQMGWDSIVQKIEDVYATTMKLADPMALPRVWAQVQRS